MQHKIRPVKGPLHATVNIPGSKSITQRAILLSALADGVSEITGMCIDNEILTFINALYQLGIVAQLDETTRSCIIAGGGGQFPKKQATLWCADSLIMTRFLVAACSSTTGVYYFDASNALRARNLYQLINILRMQRVQLIPNDARTLPFTLIGTDTLEGGEIILEEKISSQVISALLMIAPYARSPFNFSLLNIRAQHSIDMTCAMMAEYGVLVHRIHHGQFMVPVPQRYQAKDFAIETDLSLAAYFFAAAAITGGTVTVPPIKRAQSKQIASRFLFVLEKMGCQVVEDRRGLSVHGPKELKGIDVSLRHISQNFLILVTIAAFAQTPSYISYPGYVQPKALARISLLKTELIKLGIKIEMSTTWIKIYPSNPQGTTLYCHSDASIGMALALAGLKVPGVVLDQAECIIKSHPQFLISFDQLSEKENIDVA